MRGVNPHVAVLEFILLRCNISNGRDVDGYLISRTNRAANKIKKVNNMKKGFLVAFEGPDGSGKSTQLRIFKSWLESLDYQTAYTKWKSSAEIAPIIKSRKESKSLSPTEFCLLHMADFLLRLEQSIIPALNEGKIVLCDRYYFTSLARDGCRGLDKAWLLNVSYPIVPPDLVFYFPVSAEAALQRIRTFREPKYYEAGQDVTQIADPRESFKVFMKAVIDEYETMAAQYKFVRVDATQPIHIQQNHIRFIFENRYKRRLEQSGYRSTKEPVSQVII